jgi:NADP-dependent 3-hydroxy acid dehydrogenase YdfG
MNSLQGKSALVTGGGSGVGLGAAEALAAEGCQVIITGRNAEKLDAVAGENIIPKACDISDRTQVGQLFAEMGTPDIIVNSAGINVVKRALSELDPADFDQMVAINCTGLFNVLHFALPGMRERQDGLIFSISSVAGKAVYPVAGTGYTASKFGATGLAAATLAEEGDKGIRVTSIYPGEINTPILENRPVPVPAEKRAKMIHPEDIASLIVTIAKLPSHVVVPELAITPLYQEYH